MASKLNLVRYDGQHYPSIPAAFHISDMSAAQRHRSVIDSLQRILKIDLKNVRQKLLLEGCIGPNTEDVDRAISLYREFLAIQISYRDRKIVPTKEIDSVWHQHILDTRAYAQDCERIFGYFLHHYPYFGINGPEDAERLQSAFDDTLAIWRIHFSRPPFTNESLAGAAKCGDCSSCRSG